MNSAMERFEFSRPLDVNNWIRRGAFLSTPLIFFLAQNPESKFAELAALSLITTASYLRTAMLKKQSSAIVADKSADMQSLEGRISKLQQRAEVSSNITKNVVVGAFALLAAPILPAYAFPTLIATWVVAGWNERKLRKTQEHFEIARENLLRKELRLKKLDEAKRDGLQ